MLLAIDFGVERVLVSAFNMTQALRASWSDMISNYDENPEHAVESFNEEIGATPTEEALRAHTQSCRDYGYKWTPLAIKEVQELTDDQYETLSTVGKCRIVKM